MTKVTANTLLTLLVGIVLMLPGASAAGEACHDYLSRGIQLYEDMQFDEALVQLGLAIEQEAACTDQELVTLHLYSARIHIVLGQRDKALESMKSALRIDPYLSMDPVTTSPKVYEILNQARDELKREQETVVEPVPPPAGKKKSGRRIGAWTTAGVAGASAVGGGAMLAMAFSENSQQEDAADEEDWDARDTHWQNTQTYSYVSYGLFGAAAVATGVSIYLFMTSGDSASLEVSGVRFSAAPVVDGEHAGVVLQFRF